MRRAPVCAVWPAIVTFDSVLEYPLVDKSTIFAFSGGSGTRQDGCDRVTCAVAGRRKISGVSSTSKSTDSAKDFKRDINKGALKDYEVKKTTMPSLWSRG